MTSSHPARTAVITGAGGVLGAAVADRLAGPQCRLVLVDVDAEAAENTARTVRDRCDRIVVVAADVTDPDGVGRYVDAALTAGDGEVHAFFNNAGVEGPIVSLLDYPVADFERVMTVNVRGVFLGLKHLAGRMPTGAAVVNTASTGGLVGATNMIGYIASKHAVVGLTKAAALELAPRGVRVNAVCPGPIRGRMIDAIAAGLGLPDTASVATAKVPMARVADAAEVAEAVAFLLSPTSSYMTGACVPVDGGRVAG